MKTVIFEKKKNPLAFSFTFSVKKKDERVLSKGCENP